MPVTPTPGTRGHTRGRFFACVMIADGDPDEPTRTAYKALGYRLLATEGLSVQRLKPIPQLPHPVAIEPVCTPELAVRGKSLALGRSQAICSGKMRHSATTCSRWRRYRWARAQWQLRGVGTCMSTLRIGVAVSGRRCSQQCCATTGRAVRSDRCRPRATQGRLCIHAWVMSGSGRCSCLHQARKHAHRSEMRSRRS